MGKFAISGTALAVLLSLGACSSSNPVVFNTSSTSSSSNNNNSDGLVYTKDSIPGSATTISGTYVQQDSTSGEIGKITETLHAISGGNPAYTDAYSVTLASGSAYTSIYSYQDKLLKEAITAGDDFYVLDRWSYYGIIKYMGVNLGSALWGLVYQGSSGTVHITSDIALAFAQGFATDASVIDVLTGSATYSGRALIAGTGFDLSDAKSVEADSSFTVDFGDKTLTGTITPSSGSTTSFATINLAASISGNSFSGETGGTTTSGQFYGTNGNELAGTFTNASAGYYGAYGAIKGVEGDDSGGSTTTEPEYVSGGYGVAYTSAAGISRREYYSSETNLQDLFTLAKLEKGSRYTGFMNITAPTGVYVGNSTGTPYTDSLADECLVAGCIIQTVANSLYDLQHLLLQSSSASKLTLYDAGYVYFSNKSTSRLGNSAYGLNLSYGEWVVSPSGSDFYGDFTPENSMPITGTATYTGLGAIYSAYIQSQAVASRNVVPSDAAFTVDFGSKTFSGTITPKADYSLVVIDPSVTSAIELGGIINGNTIAGTKNGFVTQGYFLGPNAAELGGVFSNSDTKVWGAFGATKQ